MLERELAGAAEDERRGREDQDRSGQVSEAELDDLNGVEARSNSSERSHQVIPDPSRPMKSPATQIAATSLPKRTRRLGT